MLNDLIIIKKIKEGDIHSFEILFKQYYSSLVMYALSITSTKEVSEEIVQDIFYTFWKDREKLNLFYSVRGYLYRAVRNQALQYCEHMEVRQRHQEAVKSGKIPTPLNANPQDLLEYKELENLINRTLSRLPERRYRIFCMHRLEGKKYAEIASELSLSIKTVEAEMTKALRILRNEVEIYTRTK